MFVYRKSSYFERNSCFFVYYLSNFLLLNFLNSKEPKEKLLYSLNELINMLIKNNKIEISEVYTKATYEHEMRLLVQYLYELKLLSSTRYQHSDNRYSYDGFKMGTSFKDFLKMDL